MITGHGPGRRRLICAGSCQSRDDPSTELNVPGCWAAGGLLGLLVTGGPDRGRHTLITDQAQLLPRLLHWRLPRADRTLQGARYRLVSLGPSVHPRWRRRQGGGGGGSSCDGDAPSPEIALPAPI